MSPALQKYQSSFERSMKNFAPGLTFHAQVGVKNVAPIYLHYFIYMIVIVDMGIISERFWLIPSCEPSALLTAFMARFKSICFLGQQLPALKSEQLKSMVR